MNLIYLIAVWQPGLPCSLHEFGIKHCLRRELTCEDPELYPKVLICNRNDWPSCPCPLREVFDMLKKECVPFRECSETLTQGEKHNLHTITCCHSKMGIVVDFKFSQCTIIHIQNQLKCQMVEYIYRHAYC